MTRKEVFITLIIIGLALIVGVIVLISNSKSPISENPPFEIKEIKWESSYSPGDKCSIDKGLDLCDLIIKINVPERNDNLNKLEIGYDKEEWEFSSRGWNGDVSSIPLESVGEKQTIIHNIEPKYGESSLVLCWTTNHFYGIWKDENKAKKEYRCITKIIKNGFEK